MAFPSVVATAFVLHQAWAGQLSAYASPVGGNSNTRTALHRQDASHVLQDLDQFAELHVRFHSCAWSPLLGGDSQASDRNVNENDYWYMDAMSDFGPNVAFSLYGSLKNGAKFSGCHKKTYINSFYTTSGIGEFANAIQSFESSTLTTIFSGECQNGVGLACRDGSGQSTFVLVQYNGQCRPENALTRSTPSDLVALNTLLETEAQCTPIYYTGDDVPELLQNSRACFLNDYVGACPDPFGRRSSLSLELTKLTALATYYRQGFHGLLLLTAGLIVWFLAFALVYYEHHRTRCLARNNWDACELPRFVKRRHKDADESTCGGSSSSGSMLEPTSHSPYERMDAAIDQAQHDRGPLLDCLAQTPNSECNHYDCMDSSMDRDFGNGSNSPQSISSLHSCNSTYYQNLDESSMKHNHPNLDGLEVTPSVRHGLEVTPSVRHSLRRNTGEGHDKDRSPSPSRSANIDAHPHEEVSCLSQLGDSVSMATDNLAEITAGPTFRKRMSMSKVGPESPPAVGSVSETSGSVNSGGPNHSQPMCGSAEEGSAACTKEALAGSSAPDEVVAEGCSSPVPLIKSLGTIRSNARANTLMDIEDHSVNTQKSVESSISSRQTCGVISLSDSIDGSPMATDDRCSLPEDDSNGSHEPVPEACPQLRDADERSTRGVDLDEAESFPVLDPFTLVDAAVDFMDSVVDEMMAPLKQSSLDELTTPKEPQNQRSLSQHPSSPDNGLMGDSTFRKSINSDRSENTCMSSVISLEVGSTGSCESQEAIWNGVAAKESSIKQLPDARSLASQERIFGGLRTVGSPIEVVCDPPEGALALQPYNASSLTVDQTIQLAHDNYSCSDLAEASEGHVREIAARSQRNAFRRGQDPSGVRLPIGNEHYSDSSVTSEESQSERKVDEAHMEVVTAIDEPGEDHNSKDAHAATAISSDGETIPVSILESEAEDYFDGGSSFLDALSLRRFFHGEGPLSSYLGTRTHSAMTGKYEVDPKCQDAVSISSTEFDRLTERHFSALRNQTAIPMDKEDLSEDGVDAFSITSLDFAEDETTRVNHVSASASMKIDISLSKSTSSIASSDFNQEDLLSINGTRPATTFNLNHIDGVALSIGSDTDMSIASSDFGNISPHPPHLCEESFPVWGDFLTTPTKRSLDACSGEHLAVSSPRAHLVSDTEFDHPAVGRVAAAAPLPVDQLAIPNTSRQGLPDQQRHANRDGDWVNVKPAAAPMLMELRPNGPQPPRHENGNPYDLEPRLTRPLERRRQRHNDKHGRSPGCL